MLRPYDNPIMSENTQSPPGTVYLVGAGPGDPGLLTLRGAECLRRADVIVYDRLAHPSLLDHARPDAERVYVGKESSRHTMRQEEINTLIVERALAGKTVCRLKGGDPFVFGRGGEEAEACRAAGVPFEVVPGVTSAIAAPAYAGIPVTHREAASSFAVVTGHEDPTKPESRIRWEHLAHGTDTLVFLMGVENLPKIAGQLMRAGRAPETPVALIRWGTWPRQETLVSTLGAVVEDVERAGFKAPAVTVVGEVVRLRETLRWFDTKPLFGRRALVTRAREQASALSDLLREYGAEPVEFPVIRIAPPPDYAELDSALHRLPEYGWVVFTSANAVRAVRDRLQALGMDIRAFGEAKVAAIGPTTAGTLEEIGLKADFLPTQFVTEAVIEQWPEPDMAGVRVLLPRAKEAREILPDKLRELWAEVDVVTAYETVRDATAADRLREELLNGEIQVVTFTSSSTVKNFVESLGAEHVPQALAGITVASIGPITSQTARELGIAPTVEAKEHTIPGLVQALEEHFRRE
jgi:uroporphyrinogen III methyltransferase/synthase